MRSGNKYFSITRKVCESLKLVISKQKNKNATAYAVAFFASIDSKCLRSELVELEGVATGLSGSLVLGDDSVSGSLIKLLLNQSESLLGSSSVTCGESCLVLLHRGLENGLLDLILHRLGLDDSDALLCGLNVRH